MKKNICILTGLMAISLLFFTVNAQENIPPIPAIPPIPDIPHDKEPTVIKRVDPVYPESMLRSGGEATVYMKAFIGVDGSVIEAKIEKIQVTADNIIIDNNDKFTRQKKDGKAFEEASYNAVKQWKFSPAQMQGKPIAVWITIPFRFKLSKKETKPEEKANRAETEKGIESIKTVIENILKGKEIETTKKYIEINASLIYNTKMVNLYSVLNGEYKDMHLVEGKETQCVNFNVNITDGGNSAFIVWTSELPKGRNKRIHSIIISKSASDKWEIKHWHVSF